MQHRTVRIEPNPQWRSEPWNGFRGGDYSAGDVQAWRALEEAYQEIPSVSACSIGRKCSSLLVTLSIRFSRNPVIVDIDRVGSFGMGGWQQL